MITIRNNDFHPLKLIDDFRKRILEMQKDTHVCHIKEYYLTHTYIILIFNTRRHWFIN